MMPDFDTLADRIRNEAGQVFQPGHRERLEAIADEVERLRSGAKTLGRTIEQQGRMILDVTGCHDFIAEDGDGDWGAVWENAYDLLPRVKAAEQARDRAERKHERLESLLDEQALARLIWETSRADEGTISTTGASVIARAILAEASR